MLHPRPGIGNRKSGIGNPRSPGFTLIEIIVTIGIMLLVLSVTVVAFSPAFKTAGLKSAARTLRATIDGTRIRAVQQRRQVRFEAQLVPGSTINQWQVAASAGDLTREWRILPEFVKVETNAPDSSGDGRDGTYQENIERISVTFGPDGSVVRYVLGTHSGGLATPQVPTAPFALLLTNVREASRANAQLPHAWLVIIPLTGGLQHYDEEG